MSEHNTSRTVIDADFAGRRRRFCLRLGEMGELERLTGRDTRTICIHLGTNRFGVVEVWGTIRLGLIGGGMPSAEADALVEQEQGRPLLDIVPLAALVVSAAAGGGRPATGRGRGGADRGPPGDLSVFYGAGAVMGWTPRDVDRLTIAEFGAAADGWMAAHASRDQADITESEFAHALAEEMAAGRA